LFLVKSNRNLFDQFCSAVSYCVYLIYFIQTVATEIEVGWRLFCHRQNRIKYYVLDRYPEKQDV